MLCKGKLRETNKSGYCVKCYHHSPFYRKYQAQKQNEWYAKPENKLKRKKYMQKPKVKARAKIQQKRWQDNHKERMREIKRNWEKKHRRKRK
jgi:hypothetical protein